jgi:hypothetical protein
MKTNVSKTNKKTSNKGLFAMFVFMLLSSAGAFAQTSKGEAAPVVIENTSVATAGDTTDAQIEFVSWFMGSKQTQMNDEVKTNTISTNSNSKKQFIDKGLTPNRILSRTLMKKAINHDSTIA